MTIFEIAVVVLFVVSLISLFLNFTMFNHITSMNIYTNQLHTGVSNLLNRALVHEQILSKVGSTLEEFVDAAEQLLEQFNSGGSGKPGQLYRTMDGKYSAGTLEELVEKIKNNDEEDKYFQEEDMDKLRQLFEEDSDDDEEEEDKLF